QLGLKDLLGQQGLLLQELLPLRFHLLLQDILEDLFVQQVRVFLGYQEPAGPGLPVAEMPAGPGIPTGPESPLSPCAPVAPGLPGPPGAPGFPGAE
uniref:Uncharacterized protein n=1 Tax=Sinocyclocheilus grahami TaxID=75366 RepID=A0A672Q400_SINGR